MNSTPRPLVKERVTARPLPTTPSRHDSVLCPLNISHLVPSGASPARPLPAYPSEGVYLGPAGRLAETRLRQKQLRAVFGTWRRRTGSHIAARRFDVIRQVSQVWKLWTAAMRREAACARYQVDRVTIRKRLHFRSWYARTIEEQACRAFQGQRYSALLFRRWLNATRAVRFSKARPSIADVDHRRLRDCWARWKGRAKQHHGARRRALLSSLAA